jgi:hypothetical protein
MCHLDEHLEPAFGYLSMLESPEHGFFGGYLIISDWGRPLEFHCTAPVRPSRAQQILYGPSLRPYLLGDQLGPALLDKAKLAPQIILTDQAAGLCLRCHDTILMARIVSPTDAATACGWPTSAGRSADSVASDVGQPPDTIPPAPLATLSDRLHAGGYELELPQRFRADCQRALELLACLTLHVDLAEPFERIHEAIREAQRIGERGSDVHGQAA